MSEDPEQIMVQVHKTCYFDTYLTNIIPGNVLIRNCDKKKIGTTEELMPYREEYEIGTHKKRHFTKWRMMVFAGPMKLASQHYF